MPPTHRLCRNNPYIPYRARPGPDECILEYPYSLETAKSIFNSLSTEVNKLSTEVYKMRQCSVCHRWVTGAPSPDVGHGDVAPGPRCTLLHHPAPCPWVGDKGQLCTYKHPLPAPTPVSLPPLPLSPAASVSATYSQAVGGAPAGDLTLLQQLEDMRREKEEQARRAEQLAVANANLLHNQQ